MIKNWQIRDLIEKAFLEDIPFKDITSEIIIPPDLEGKAYFLAKEKLVVCGEPIVEEIFKFVDPQIRIIWKTKEGEEIEAYTKIGYVEGNIRNILKCERIALNFFQHLSGIATYTRKIVKKIAPYSVILLDTRKTLPGLKLLQKYAVQIGGGQNHRFSLSDGILIKDNHIKALGGIKEVLKKLKNIPHYLRVEIEVKSLEELTIILDSDAPIEIVLLDNFSLEDIKKAIELIKKKKPSLKIEVSGGINLENIENIAKLEINFISCGALTHSVKAVDISLKIETVYK